LASSPFAFSSLSAEASLSLSAASDDAACEDWREAGVDEGEVEEEEGTEGEEEGDVAEGRGEDEADNSLRAEPHALAAGAFVTVDEEGDAGALTDGEAAGDALGDPLCAAAEGEGCCC
jgi:hypothetical protein